MILCEIMGKNHEDYVNTIFNSCITYAEVVCEWQNQASLGNDF